MEASARAEIAVESPHEHGVSFGAAMRVWSRIALLSFGGPAGPRAVMHRILVEEMSWIGEERVLHALNTFILLPAPEAPQPPLSIAWSAPTTTTGRSAAALFGRH